MAAVFLYTILNAILLLYSCDHIVVKVKGRVTTTLPEVAIVCNGSQLELNCTITGSILEWRIIPEQNHSQLSPMIHYPTRNQSFQYGDSTVTFTIISQAHPMELTLYRTVISPVTNSLNGTEVECIDFEDQELSSSTVINIVNDQDFDSILVRAISEYFNRDNVEVSLEWVPDNSLHTYHVNVAPQPAFSMKLKRNSIHLKVEYNVLYNLSIVIVSPCGQTVTINEIYYYVSYYDMQGGHTSAATISNKINSVSDSGITITAIAAAIGSSGFLLLITLVIVFICMVLFAKRKGARRILDGDYANDTVGTEHDYIYNDPIKVATSGPVYAEVSHKQPTRQQTNDLLELDDTRVEYAQLKHNQLANACNPSWTESQLPNGTLPVQVDITNFQGAGHSATVLVPPPRIPPKKATGNENPSQVDVFQSQMEPNEIWVPALPPKPKK